MMSIPGHHQIRHQGERPGLRDEHLPTVTAMDNKQLDKVLDDLMETLAAIEHERWSRWQRYLHGKCSSFGADDSLVIPGDLVKRWEAQVNTAYSNLPEAQKESDGDQVRQYLSVISAALRDPATD
jgi:hypothetical protein